MVVLCPSVRLYAVILKVLELCSCELATLCDDLSTAVVFHTHRGLVLGEGEELVNENVLEVVVLCLILLVDLGQCDLVLFLRLTGLDSACEQLLVDNDTAE